MTSGRRGQRGVVVLLTLWTLALLALLAARLVSGGRTDLRLTGMARDAAAVRAAADGAVYEAIWRLAAGGELHWFPDSRPRATVIGGVAVTVTIEDLAGRLNPNLAPPELIGALLARLGMPADQAMAEGAAFFDWHMPGARASPGGAKLPEYRAAGLAYGPPGQPFEHDSEIAAVLGMTPNAAAALRPFLSIYNEGAIVPARAAPVLRQALEDTGTNQPGDPATAPLTVEIQALARTDSGAAFPRRAVVRFKPGEPFRILNWTAAEP
jgi:general secretion pathway protein K